MYIERVAYVIYDMNECKKLIESPMSVCAIPICGRDFNSIIREQYNTQWESTMILCVVSKFYSINTGASLTISKMNT